MRVERIDVSTIDDQLMPCYCLLSFFFFSSSFNLSLFPFFFDFIPNGLKKEKEKQSMFLLTWFLLRYAHVARNILSLRCGISIDGPEKEKIKTSRMKMRQESKKWNEKKNNVKTIKLIDSMFEWVFDVRFYFGWVFFFLWSTFYGILC